MFEPTNGGVLCLKNSYYYHIKEKVGGEQELGKEVEGWEKVQL